MKAQVIKSYNELNAFELLEVDKPKLKRGYVQIKVMATSINPIDTKIKQLGMPPIAPSLPAVLGTDVSGIIEELGESVSDFKVGDEVYGCAGGCYNENGTLAEYMCADAKLLAIKPKNLSFTEAAALPLISITAYEALIDKGIKPKDKVLIHGGCGGVGHIAIQMAKLLDANVYTTVSTPVKAKIAKQLGVDDTILYNDESVSEYVNRLTYGTGFDLVMDTVGPHNLSSCFEAIRIMGKVITIIAYGSAVDLRILHSKAASLHTTFMLLPMYTGQNREKHGQILKKLSNWVENKSITPIIDREFDFKDTNKAYDYFMQNKHIGKVVINLS